jgi:diguanylate cyclase (GGDEF)-like protein
MMRSESSSPIGSIGPSRSTIRFVAPILVSLAVMLLAAVISIEVLSTVRAWVGGESLYSKGQKDATYYLARYTASHSDADYVPYLSAIALPLGDRQARMALQQRPADLAAARAGFLEAGNYPADIGSAILLFRLFGRFGPVRQAIEFWTAGDSYTMRLTAIAARLHPPDGPRVSAEEQASVTSELYRINGELGPLTAKFAAKLGDLARLTRTLLVIVLALGTLIIGWLCIAVTHARVRERDAKEHGLARLTELYAALSQTSQLISRVSDRRELFDELCRICVGASGLMLAAVGSLKKNQSGIEFLASHGQHPEYLKTLASIARAGPRISDSALHLTLRDGASRIVHGRVDSLFPSEAAFPMRCQGELVGVLCVFSQERLFFRTDIVELMEQLAMEASFALESLHWEVERRYKSDILADQNRILSLIASGAGLSSIFSTLARFVEAQSGGQLCSLVALESGAARCTLGVAPSLPASFGQSLAESARGELAIPCFEAIRSGNPVLDRCVDAYAAVAPLQAAITAAGVQSVSAWPIMGTKGQAIGSLALYRPQGVPARPPDEHLIGVCTSVAGIAIESCWAAERIRHLAHHDELTRLPNRLLFGYQLPQALARAGRTGGSVGVFFIDLDRFKVINDTLGHDAGDNVLRQIAQHLQACVRSSDTLARVGGDEFALIVEQFSDVEELSGIAQKLLVAMSKPLRIAAREYQLSGSVGIALYPKDGADSSSLLKHADIAMYRAKASGKNTFHFYSDEIDVHSVDRLALENELRQALERREIEVHYQPKVDLRTGRISGAEALVRWRHPQRGMLLPGDFIFVAEEMGLISALGNRVLEQVCADLAGWRAHRLPLPRVAMNLSARQFADLSLIENLNHALSQSGCDPSSLEFEITESVVMTDPEQALQLLEQIKTYGITLAIDDFGTGHSSLGYLKRFPVDSIKIDYTFVRDIANDPDDLAIVRAIIALGHSLDLKVIAEGVETVTQLEILRRLQCDEFQGFLFSSAVSADSFINMLMLEARARPGTETAETNETVQLERLAQN